MMGASYAIKKQTAIDVVMIWRECPCGTKFKVKDGSKQIHCTYHCQSLDDTEGLGWRARTVTRRKAMREEKLATESASVQSTLKTKSSEMQNVNADVSIITPIGEQRVQETKDTTELTNLPAIKEDMELQSKPESLDPQADNLETAALDSMSLLKRSNNKLLSIIEECSDPKSGRQNLMHALDAARILAQSVQVQVNMCKVMRR